MLPGRLNWEQTRKSRTEILELPVQSQVLRMMFIHPTMQFQGVPASFYHLMPVFPTNQGMPQCYSSLHRPSLPVTHIFPTDLEPVLQLLGTATLVSPDTHKATESCLCLPQFKQFPQVVYSFLSCHAPQLHSTSGTSHTPSTCCGNMQQLPHPSIPSP